MRLIRISLTILLALAATVGCGRKTEIEEFKARWIRLKHTPIEEARVGVDAPVTADTEVSPDVTDIQLFLYYSRDSEPHEVVPMKLLDAGKYFASIPSHKRGTLIEYYVEARAGADLVVRVPGEKTGPGFSFYYKGAPNRILLIIHIVLMFVSIAIFLLSGYLAFKAIRDRKITMRIPRLAFLGSVVFFVSSFPLGMIVAHQTFGKPWTGFPLGTDLTDNKSLAIVLYWAAAAFLYRGSVFRRDPSTDVLSMRALPYVYIAGVIITAVLFLIPH
ncbi:MAG: hypothetical protein ABIJ00_15885 [Candidatus Eisenbacteria bacterium]